MKKTYFNLLALTSLLAVIYCVSSSSSTNDEIRNGIRKIYFVQGMTCGGCIVHVSTVMERDSKTIAYAQKKIGVGLLELTFKAENYSDQKTDCAIKDSIESSTEYRVFYDRNYSSPVCPKPSQGKL